MLTGLFLVFLQIFFLIKKKKKFKSKMSFEISNENKTSKRVCKKSIKKVCLISKVQDSIRRDGVRNTIIEI